MYLLRGIDINLNDAARFLERSPGSPLLYPVVPFLRKASRGAASCIVGATLAVALAGNLGEAQMADRSGQQLGNYRLLRLLGRGGFAEVYLGQHIYLGSQAALKVLSLVLTDEDTGQFAKEARTLASLNHPHIIRVLEFAIENNTPFLVMEYANNGTLRQLHPQG